MNNKITFSCTTKQSAMHTTVQLSVNEYSASALLAVIFKDYILMMTM